MSSVKVPGSALNASLSSGRRARHRRDGERLLEREHVFDHRAEFRALRGIAAGEVLVAGEHAVGQAVILVECGDHLRTAWRSASEPETSDQTAPVLMAWPLFTP